MPACKQEPTAADSPASTASAPAGEAAASPAGPPTASADGIVTPALPQTLAPSYTAELEPLLDLVPADASTFGVVRDPLEFVDGFAWTIEGQAEMWRKTLDASANPAAPDADAGIRKLLLEIESMRSAIPSHGVHLERGLMFTQIGERSVVVLAADNPENVPALLRALVAKPDEVKSTCRTVPEAAGFVACADEPAALAAYAPGLAGKALRERITGLLDADCVANGNVVALVAKDGEAVPFTVMTAPGLLQTDFRVPDPSGATRQLEASGPATGLGYLRAGNSFNWARIGPDALAKAGTAAPAIMKNAVRALSGEVLVASPGAHAGFAVMVGLTDPTPIAGLLPMAMLAKDNIPPLPDGSKVALELADVDDGKGGKVQTLRASVNPSGELASLRDAGLVPEISVFVTPSWAVVALGTGPEIVKDIVAGSAGEPSSELLAALPPAFANALADERVAVALHVELDGFHAPGLREQLVQAVAGLPATPGESLPLSEAIAMALVAVSPLSSVSVWGAGDANGMLAHVALRSFGDPASEEGRAAHVARLAVDAGREPPASAYGELARRYPSSARAPSYRTRAGAGGTTGAASGAAIAGMLAAIAIPAFKKYMERAKASESKRAASDGAR